MSELDANIMNHFEDKHDVDVGSPSIHIHKNHNTRTYVVHPVTYYKTPKQHEDLAKDTRQKYQTYVHNEQDSTDVHAGLPKKLGGDVVLVK